MEPKRPSKLRDCRHAKGWTLKDLQRVTGIHSCQICMIEYGHVGCGELTARRLADVFGGDWKDFVTKKINR